MVLFSKEDAHAELEPYEAGLRGCVLAAFADMRRVQSEINPGMGVRARRTLLQDLVVRDMHNAYSEVPSFQVVDPKRADTSSLSGTACCSSRSSCAVTSVL
jgi:hypothetical protein